MTTPAKIEPWMVEAVKEMMVKHLGFGAFFGTNWMLLESDLVAIIAAHAPKQEWEAKEKALRVFILRNADHGVDDTGEYCRAGAFTRTVFEDGTAEVYPCTCGLDELRTILNREQEKQP